ncbi:MULTISPECIES: hypothetical protein [unclassified Variovorax]|uniref:hypothetical protein n=1 Tax=unclassified Variovorax TaxID=663243 RepID=UPI0032E5A230
MSEKSFVIRLGARWRMFASERDGMTFLGTVQSGVAGIGALARTCDGGYVQVNGDVVAVLDARKIRLALRMRPDKTEGQPCATHLLDDRLVADHPRWPQPVLAATNSLAASAPRPVITVKKRRVAVRVTTGAAQASEQASEPADQQGSGIG